MSRVLDKKDFCRYMKGIQDVYDYHDDLNDFFGSHRIDGYLFQPDCMDVALSLLEFIFNDKDQWISYWIYELDFGRDYRDGSVTYASGEAIPMKTAEELYDFLINELKEGKVKK